MTTYTISQFKAKAAEILDTLSEGEEVIITRRGKPCAVITSVLSSNGPSKADESTQAPQAATDAEARTRLSIEELRGRVVGAWPEWVTLGEAPKKLPLQEKYAHLPDLSYEEIQAAQHEMNEAWKRKFDDILGDDAK